MGDAIITVDNLGKRYSLRHQSGEAYSTFRDVVAHKVKRLFYRNGDAANPRSEDFWALRHVSFEVKQGEVLGIIGRNGAGKSTLLKILSRITEPTEGRVRLRGRVASLLEVGTGFHPELTGRENIYLNGAILGMSRTEIRAKFDEIVAFAETDKFLDTPVKRYSSGMYVRLAFAVAAHLEPEILIVDEVLAVGDAEFQKKCLGKMGEVARGGRTILFVSHNMAAINRLCSRCLLLIDGTLVAGGLTESIVSKYLSQGTAERSVKWSAESSTKEGEFRFVSLRVLGSAGDVSSTLSTGQAIIVEIQYIIQKPIRNLRVTLRLQTGDGVTLFESSDLSALAESRSPGRYVSSAEIPPQLLNVGTYLVSVAADIPMERLLAEAQTIRFAVEELATNQMVVSLHGKPLGIIHPCLKWTVSERLHDP